MVQGVRASCGDACGSGCTVLRQMCGCCSHTGCLVAVLSRLLWPFFSYSRYCSLPAVYKFACKNTHKFLKIKIKSHISACGGRNMAFEIRVVCAGGCVAGVATERLRCHMRLLCRSQSGFVSFCVSCGFFAPKRSVYMRSVAPR